MEMVFGAWQAAFAWVTRREALLRFEQEDVVLRKPEQCFTSGHPSKGRHAALGLQLI